MGGGKVGSQNWVLRRKRALGKPRASEMEPKARTGGREGILPVDGFLRRFSLDGRFRPSRPPSPHDRPPKMNGAGQGDPEEGDRELPDGRTDGRSDIGRGTDAVTLEDAAKLVEEPIERDRDGREIVRKSGENGCRIEFHRSHFFDDRGVRIELFGPGDRKPRMSTSVFPMTRFRQVMNWFSYLCRRSGAVDTDGSLKRLTREYNQTVFDWEANRLP